MTVRIEATYPATDGRSPEAIVVAWEDDADVPNPDEIGAVIDALAQVPNHRVTPTGPGFADPGGLNQR